MPILLAGNSRITQKRLQSELRNMKKTKEKNEATGTVSNPFDNLEDFKVAQDFNEFETAVDFSIIPLRKPGRQEWFRVNPEIELTNVCFLDVEQNEGSPESYLVTASVAPLLRELPGMTKRSLHLCVCRPNGTPFVWPVKLPKGNGTKHDDWGRSALEAAKKAKTEWIRMNSDMQLGAYKCYTSSASWEEPTWPELGMAEILKRSVGEQHIIASTDHPVIRQLQGLE